MTLFEPTTATRAPRNPFELLLGFGAAGAVVLGLIVSIAATAAYERGADVTALANTLSGAYVSTPDGGALVWAGLGTQLWQLGVLVLVGLSFYWMAQWNKSRQS